MKLLLDTDICIYAIKRKHAEMLARLRSYSVGEVGISAITYAELRFGIENSLRRDDNLQRLEQFLLPLVVLPFDADAGRSYGRVRRQLQAAGLSIGGNDLLIAAHALSLGATLVTNNVREFERVDGLAVERWVEK